MSLYGKHVLHWMIDVVGKEKSAADLRKRLIPSARGVVVEIGMGSALNMPFYSARAVTQLFGIDPSAELLSMARPKLDGSPFPIELLHQTAANVPLATHPVATAATTSALCSTV